MKLFQVCFILDVKNNAKNIANKQYAHAEVFIHIEKLITSDTID